MLKVGGMKQKEDEGTKLKEVMMLKEDRVEDQGLDGLELDSDPSHDLEPWTSSLNPTPYPSCVIL